MVVAVTRRLAAVVLAVCAMRPDAGRVFARAKLAELPCGRRADADRALRVQLRVDPDGTVWRARGESPTGCLELARRDSGDDRFRPIMFDETARAFALAPGGWLYFVHGGRLDDAPIRYYSPIDDRVREIDMPRRERLTVVGDRVIAWSDDDRTRYALRHGRVVSVNER